MQPNEAFRLGFLARCVEEGLSADATFELSKQAAAVMEKAALTPDWIAQQLFGPVNKLTGAVKGVGDAASSMMPYVGAAMAVPPLLGGTAAYLVNHATDTDAADVEEAKNHELAETYNRMASQLQRQKQLQAYKAKRKSSGRVFL